MCGLIYMQNRLAGKISVDEPAGDPADLAPYGLDRDLRLETPGLDLGGEQGEADAAALDAHQLVEQSEAVKPRAAGGEEVTALDAGGARCRDAEGYAGAVRRQ